MDSQQTRGQHNFSPATSSASSRAPHQSWKTASSSRTVPGEVGVGGTAVPLRAIRVPPPMELPATATGRRKSLTGDRVPTGPPNLTMLPSPPREGSSGPLSAPPRELELPPTDTLLVDGIAFPPDEVLGALGSLRHISEYRAARPLKPSSSAAVPKSHARMRVLVVEVSLCPFHLFDPRTHFHQLLG